MEPAVWGFIGVIVGGLITGLVTFAVELLRTIGAGRLDRYKRLDNRRLDLDSFQRQTLVDLQNATTELMKTVTRLRSITRMSTAEMTQEERQLVAEVSTEEQRLRLLVATLRSRVADDRIRDLTDTFLRTTGAIWAKHPDAADEAIDTGSATAKEIVDLAGVRIRETFLVELKRPI